MYTVLKLNLLFLSQCHLDGFSENVIPDLLSETTVEPNMKANRLKWAIEVGQSKLLMTFDTNM